MKGINPTCALFKIRFTVFLERKALFSLKGTDGLEYYKIEAHIGNSNLLSTI
jgi:hypothetical protein